MRGFALTLIGFACLGAASAEAQDGAGCAKFKWPIAREQAAFAGSGLPGLTTGQSLPGVLSAASVTLAPQAEVVFVHPPARKPKVDPAYAAVLTVPPLAAAGTYAVTLSQEAWIDVLQDGKEVRSSGFSGQPDCPGVRKSVKFSLAPGAATIQLSGAAQDMLKIEVLPAE